MGYRRSLLAAVLIALVAQAALAQKAPSPSELLGMKIGEDRVLVVETFEPPVRNALAGATDFSAPGTLLRAHITPGHPVTYGLPREAALFVDAAIAFETTPPASGTDRWVLATYPDDERDMLLSGWASGLERLERRAAAVATTHGKGRLVLFGFRPQFRAQTTGTFPFLFNALYWSVLRN